MKINDYISKIKNLGACGEAIEAAHNYTTSQELWDDCKRGDWMLWLAGKLSGEPEGEKRKRLVLTACKCARLSLVYVKDGELRPLKAIETAEKWAKGEDGVSIQDVREAADAAVSAADAAYAASAASAAYAAYAAAAASAASAGGAAAYVADAAADAAYAKPKKLAKCSDIVREYYPDVDVLFGTERIEK